MSRTLKLVWKDENGDSFNVGKLTLNTSKYYFEYNENEVMRAKAYGFELLPGFPKTNVRYFKEQLFKTFEEWLMEKNYEKDEMGSFCKDLVKGGFCFVENREVP